MAPPMITDSYSKYNSAEFGGGGSAATNQSANFYSSSMQQNKSVYNPNKYNGSSAYENNNESTSANGARGGGSERLYTSDEEVDFIDTFRGSNDKKQIDSFGELTRICFNDHMDQLHKFKKLPDLLDAIGNLLLNTSNSDVLKVCLKFIQNYFKSADRFRLARKNDSVLNANLKRMNAAICDQLLPYLIEASVSPQLQLKQMSIDVMYTFMKTTENVTEYCFTRFVRSGIENSTELTAKQFIDPTLNILITEEFANADFAPLVQGLVKKMFDIPKFEPFVMKVLNKIRAVVKPEENFEECIRKLPSNLLSVFKAARAKPDRASAAPAANGDLTNIDNGFNSAPDKTGYKFNFIPPALQQALNADSESQRLQAISQLEACVKNVSDIKKVYPHYQEFIQFMNQFVDDTNYEVRVCSLKILCNFIQKLGPNVNLCINHVYTYDVICDLARNVVSQTHQSKTIKQYLTSMILITIDFMAMPAFVLESLLDKIKDRPAKAREEILNIIIASVLKFAGDKFESLRKVFYQTVPLMCDIKRNVRHAALECIAVLYTRIRDYDRSWGNLLDQLEHVPDLGSYDNISSLREVILYRVNRNRIATLNQTDYTVDYGLKIPATGVAISSAHDLDIEWIISASSTSSATVSNQSSARSTRSFPAIEGANNNVNNAKDVNNFYRNLSLNDANVVISTGSLRRPSGYKRLPWDDVNDASSVTSSHSAPKATRAREVAPLKAFPLNDNLDFLNGGFNSTNSKNGYPTASSYQEKYLKKTQSEIGKLNSSKTDSQLEITDAAKRLQSEKAYSLDNLYNFDENINSEDAIQKRKYANLNLKNSIIPSKPAIARRNSASKYNSDSSNTMTNRSNQFDIDPAGDDFSNQFLVDDLVSDRTDGSQNNGSKYETVPNIRNSAKNRKKLEKIFSLGTNEENNLYLSKLKAEKNNNETSSSRHSASNPESGIFSMSDYDQSENRFIKMQQNYNPDGKKQVPNSKSSNVEYNPLAGVSFKQNHTSDVEIVGVKLGNQNGQDNVNIAQKKKNSLKNLNESVFNTDKENGAPDLLDIVGRGYSQNGDAEYNNNGQFNPDKKLFDNSNDYVPTISDENNEFPLSSSFKSRLKQKTMEKIEEKQRKKIEKSKSSKQRDTFDPLNNDSPVQDYTPEPYQGNNNFGLSISGYNNGFNPNGNKSNFNNQDDPRSYNGDDYPIKSKQNNNNLNDYNEYDDGAYPSNINTLLDKPKFQPTKATQARLKAKAAALAATTNPEPLPVSGGYSTTAAAGALPPAAPAKKPREIREAEYDPTVGAGVKEEFVQQPFKNPESALREAMNNLAQDEDWEKKCHGMNIIRRLTAYHEDVTVANIHSIILALVQEVKNLRSQVARFALLTFGDLFVKLKRVMDVDLDLTVKNVLQKNGESNDFIRTDVDKCLDKMVNNVTVTKAMIALLSGGASHRNPLVRRTAAQYIYKSCEIMGPGKLLSGIKDLTERLVQAAAQFVVDGPPDIRWYGRKIFYILMSHDDFDRLLVRYLNETSRKNIKEILDTIRVKGPGEAPTESARNARKNIRSVDSVSRSAGANNQYGGTNTSLLSAGSTFASDSGPPSAINQRHGNQATHHAPKLDQASQETIKQVCAQLRNNDFRERMEAIERFQILCETQPNLVVPFLVQIFDKFNACLTDTNSKVNYKALNTMYQITPLLGNDLNPVITNAVPLVAQNLASKNSEIQDMAANILEVFVEYLDGGSLIQPFTNLAQHGNARVKPTIILKLADLIPTVYTSKKKQVELHVLPCLWVLLNSVKGHAASSGSGPLNNAIAKLVNNLYEQMGEQLIDRAANSSNVSTRNLELLKEMLGAY